MKGSRRRAERTAEIRNCEDLFRFRCPQLWQQLEATSDEGVRHCSVCAKSVFYCNTLADAERLAGEGKCVALEYDDRHVVGNMKVSE